MRFTSRGFAIYSKFRDQNGRQVRLQQSSDAERDCVWIFCHAIDTQGQPLDQDEAPHLTRAQARRVRDALDRFLAHTSPRQRGRRAAR